ncbi:MAG: thymidylate synthase [Clostridia bacterium]|nr:thymidylate synthase [Clostridia bacterium]
MEENILLHIHNRAQFRSWLEENAHREKECWLQLKRGKPVDAQAFYYLDAVEEALCFGWIDSIQKKINGMPMQRFSPRSKNSHWTELNKARVRRLEALGLMCDAGRAVLPPMGTRSFHADAEIVGALKANRVWSRFRRFPPLYQRVKLSNIAFYKSQGLSYESALQSLIAHTKKGEMYGEWDDYGRLSEEI